jgi:hypothetical protein
MFAHVPEGETEPVADLIVHRGRDAQTARLGEGFDPRGDIDAVVEDVVALNDDVPEIDPDRKRMRWASSHRASRSIMPRCTSTAQRTASTTRLNSTSMPSSVVLTMRPR